LAEAATAPAGSQGLFWLSCLMGERTPHLDALARGGWIGLTAKHTRADLIRSVIEGVSYSQKDYLSIVEELGVEVSSVSASSGGGE
jgi:xylulokinase